MRIKIAVVLGLAIVTAVCGEAPRVRPSGESSNDSRLGPPKTLNDHFPFVVPGDVAQWHQRAQRLRNRVLVATGLWPMPERAKIDPVIYGKSEREGFTVEKVYFESLPGHYVTGLLFRPSDPSSARAAGVLCPHGHGGRMQTFTDEEIEAQLAQGGEHFRESGRTPKLARCAQLARMGCVSFIFDMLGYADSIQIPFEFAHRHKDPRPEELEANDSGWVFFSREADLRLQSIMGLQTWNAIRALDFLASLPDVDPDRLAVTGGSGGGTQSILLGAIDDRIKVSFPNGMVSTSMQGGCYCENCNLLRIDTGNVELAALFAPRPQAMTAADDWTRDMMTDGYPQLKWLYAMVGNEKDVYCRPMLDFKHNYNYIARATMYQWMNRHLELGLDDPVIEQNFVPLTDAETSVWNDEHPRPTNVGIEHERTVCRWFDEQARGLLNATWPSDEETLQAFREAYGSAWQVVFDQGLPDDVQHVSLGTETRDGIRLSRGLLMSHHRGCELPLLTLQSARREPTSTIIWTSDEGKDAAFDDAGNPSKGLSDLLEGGAVVMLPDLMRQGEWGGQSNERGQRLVDDERSYSAFTFAYNRTLVAERCGDLMTVIAHAVRSESQAGNRGEPGSTRSIHLLATGESACWAAPAVALAGALVNRAILVTDGFRFAQADGYEDPHFVPGAVKYGDLPALLALRAPHALMVLGEPKVPELTAAAYSAAGATPNLRLSVSPEIEGSALAWLLDESRDGP